MHLLFAHLQHHIDKYHAIGLFSEDSMKSIHAIINRLDHVYASLDSEWKPKAILKLLTARKMWTLAKQNELVMKNLIKEEDLIMKRKCRQGIAKDSMTRVPFIGVTMLLAPDATQV
jgi:hypothetical protein